MDAKHLLLFRRMAALFCLSAVSTAAGTEFTTSETAEPQPAPNEWVMTLFGVNMDEATRPAQVRESLGLADEPSGGLERLFWRNDPYADWHHVIEARWLVRPEEVALSYTLKRAEKATFKVDFRHWLQYEFAAGPFYPPTSSFFVLSPDELKREINQIEVSLQLQPSEFVRVNLAYGLMNRRGARLSTRYGDDFEYLISRTTSRGIIPARLDSEETVHTVDLSVVREEEGNRSGARLWLQSREVASTRVTERAARQPAANRFTRDTGETKDDLFGLSGYTRRQLRENLVGSLGAAFTRLDGDITGSRVFGASPEAAYDIDFAARQLDDRGYLNLESTRSLSQWILNANTVYTPGENYRWMAGVRLEHLSSSTFGSYIDTVDQVDWAAQLRQNEEAFMSTTGKKEALDLSGFIEGRYTGFAKTVLFSRVQLASQSGDLDESWIRQELVPDARQSASLLDRSTGFDRETAFWETGFHYTPVTALRLSLQGYLKQRDNSYDYDGLIQPAEDYTLYPGYIDRQKFTTQAVNARAHWRILSNLRSVTRIDLQSHDIDTESRVSPMAESSTRDRLVFNQTLSWNPHPRFFITGAFHYVEDLTKTGAADLEGTFAGIIVNVPNDYWQADFNLYTVLSKRVDLQLGYHYLEMNNFVDNSPVTVPFGTDLKEHNGRAMLIFRLQERLLARLGYQYFERTEPSAAGNRDVKVHLFRGSLQYVF